MRTLITLSGLTLFALATTARAQEAAPAATPPPPVAETASAKPAAETPVAIQAEPAAIETVSSPASNRKIHVGLSFLPMALGKYTKALDAVNVVSGDARFAYGVGLSVGYEVLPRLVVGIAPQYTLNVKEKSPEDVYDTQRQIDLMARVAYVLPVADNTSVYAEVLPGFSIITEAAAKPMGFVIAGGVGAIMDLSDRFFLNLGAGYQKGFQSWSEGKNTFKTRTQYVRVSMGGGVKF